MTETSIQEISSRKRWRPAPLYRITAACHAAGLIVMVLAPDRWLPVLAIGLANHLLLAAGCLWPRSQLLGPNLSRLPAAAAAAGQVALTFDDGPDPEVTPQVLDLLDRYGAGATFFCIGRRARQHPEVVVEIVRRGHRVESHGWSHSHRFAFRGWRGLSREIDRAQELLEHLSGRRPRLFRAPAGIRSPLLAPLLAQRRLQLVSWSRRGFDAVARDPAKISRRLLRGLAGGDVLLLHDGGHRGPGRAVILDVLPRVLEQIQAQGLASVPLVTGTDDGRRTIDHSV